MRGFPIVHRLTALIVTLSLAAVACAPPATPSPTTATSPGQTSAPASPPVEKQAEKPAAQPPAKAPEKAAAAPADLNAQLDAYYQKARTSGETKVTHYGLGPEYQGLIKVFQEKFPGVSVENVNLRGPEMIQRINAEAASGKYVANVASTGLTTMGELERLERLVKWSPPTASMLPEPEGGSDGYRWMTSVGLFGIVVNTSLVPADKVPTKRLDLLDPFFKGSGKLLTEDPRAAGGGQSFWVIAYDDLGQEFLDKVKAQDITMTRERDAAPAQIARGEYMLYFAAGVNDELLELERTAPVKVHFFRDGGAHYTDITAGVVKDAPGQDVAKLWVSWLTSPDGQRELVDKVKTYPSLAGIGAPGGWPSFEEIKPKSRTAQQRARNNDYIAIFEKTFFQ